MTPRAGARIVAIQAGPGPYPEPACSVCADRRDNIVGWARSRRAIVQKPLPGFGISVELQDATSAGARIGPTDKSRPDRPAILAEAGDGEIAGNEVVPGEIVS